MSTHCFDFYLVIDVRTSYIILAPNLPSSIGGWTAEEWSSLDNWDADFLGFLASIVGFSSLCVSYRWNMSPYWDLLLDGAFFFPRSSPLIADSSLLEWLIFFTR